MPAETLYIIDGYAAFFRCYHAIRTVMTSPVTREPTNMTFGFIGMLLKLLRAEGANIQTVGGKPTFLALALDVGGDRGTFRSELYPLYKANRDAPPEDLQQQVERCLQVLTRIGVPVIGAPGFEADDVIATLVERMGAEHPELQVRLVSKDKDLKQLLSGDRVCMFDVHTDSPFTQATLEAQTGLQPRQVIDMLTLMGDASDNVPGIDGVGEKTAAKLIKDYGTLEALVANPSKVSARILPRLLEAIESGSLALAKKLITLRRDVPFTFDLAAARVTDFDLPSLIPALKELGFNRYQDDVRAIVGGASGIGGGQARPSRLGLTGPTSTLAATPPNTPNIPAFRSPPTASANAQPTPAPRRRFAKSSEPILGGGLFEAMDSALSDSTSGAAFLIQQPDSRLDAPVFITAHDGEYRAITTAEELQALVHQMAASRRISIDTETTGLSPHTSKLCGISISTQPGKGYYIPVMAPAGQPHLSLAEVVSALRPVLENGEIAKCGHNLKFDINMLRAAGIRLAGLTPPHTPAPLTASAEKWGGCDSMIASYLLDASRSSHSLDSLSLAFLGRTNISLSQLLGTGKSMRTFDTISIPQAAEYAGEDADVTLRLVNTLMPAIEQADALPLLTEVELPLVETLAEMEWNGVRVDTDELDRQRTRLAGRIEILRSDLARLALESIGRVFDPDSPRQLAQALFNSPEDLLPGLGIKPSRKTKTGFSTDAEVLESLTEDDGLETPIPALVLEYRQLTKLVSTYLVALKAAVNPVTGRVHTSFNQTVAATGRLASSDPNLQNIPIRTDIGRDIRRAFVAEPGFLLVTADYSQIELRLLAHLSRDEALIGAFLRDEDIHTAVAAQIHKVPLDQVTRDQRSGAKMVNFGIVYGITAFGLARRLKIPQDQAATIIDGYRKRFPGIATFLQECIESARSNGYVETILKRRRPILDSHSRTPSRRALAERLAINTVVQGSAADLIKVAMVRLHREVLAAKADPAAPMHGAKMLLQIHDELVFEVPIAKAPAAQLAVKTAMEGAMQLSVPIRVDAHTSVNWCEGK